MSDLIARLVARLLCALLFPVGKRHAADSDVQPPAHRTPDRRAWGLPERMSPYAREVAEMENRPICDTTDPVRPYVLMPYRAPKATAEERMQSYRRWALDMATRGLDVGPTRIHGVNVCGDASAGRTLRVAVGA